MNDKELEELKKLGFSSGANYKRIRQSCLCLSTGVFPIDLAIGETDDEGFAGMRERDILELLGPNNALKSAISISMMAETIKRFGPHSVVAVFSEPPDPARMEQAGIDMEDLLVYELYTYDDEGRPKIKQSMAEDALAALLVAVQNPKIKLAVIDSVAALMPSSVMFDKKDIRDLNSNPVAAAAKVVNNFIDKFANVVAKAVLVLINHYNEPINIDISQVFMDQSKIQTTAGRGKEFGASVRILCNTSIKLDEEKNPIFGTKQGRIFSCTWKLIKNKYCPTTLFRTPIGEFDPRTGKFNNVEMVLKCAAFFGEKNEKNEVVSIMSTPVAQAGAWTYIGTEKFNGIDKAVEFLKDSPQVVDKLKKELYPLNDLIFEGRKKSLEELLEDDS